MERVIEEIIKKQKTCYFISPHLDDAAFSGGGLISYLAAKTRVVVVTAFTAAGKDKHSLSARAFLRKCGYRANEVDKFFDERRKEDRQLFESVGVEVVHLGFLDALWRAEESPNTIYKFLSFFINDFAYIYPTHRLHISKGRIHRKDRDNLRKLEKKLKEIVDGGKNSVVFCPLGLGKHVDHVVVREACSKIFPEVIYWEDSPYNLYYGPDKAFVEKNYLTKFFFRKNQPERYKMYPAYKTQFGKLFGGRKDFNLPPETYYFKNSRRNKENDQN